MDSPGVAAPLSIHDPCLLEHLFGANFLSVLRPLGVIVFLPSILLAFLYHFDLLLLKVLELLPFFSRHVHLQSSILEKLTLLEQHSLHLYCGLYTEK